MKSLALAFSFLLFVNLATAQDSVNAQSGVSTVINKESEQRPRTLLSGDIRLTGEQVLGEFSYNGSVNVSAGYLVYKGLLVGSGFSVSIAPNSRYYEVVPIARYYWFLNNRHALYVGGSGGYGWGKDITVFTNSNVDNTEKGRYSWVWGGRAGYLSMFNENVGLDIFGYYNRRLRASQKVDGTFTEPSMTAAFGIGFGLQVFL